jgi:tetratricopeptide (TPR) repeat protein
MSRTLEGLAATARRAAAARDWPGVRRFAREILAQERGSAEGWFLSGLAENGLGRPQKAAEAFERALRYDANRYDAAVELARLRWSELRHADARRLLERHEPQLDNSPLYLEMAAETWSRLGLHARAWPLYRRAVELQPGAERLRAGLAASSVLLGRIEEARDLYRGLLDRHPQHQRNHYELSRLARATDRSHIEQMLSVLKAARLPPERNIFLYYAIAKELEDLGEWEESFRYYEMGGDAAAAAAQRAGYTVESDVSLIDRIQETCDEGWLNGPPGPALRAASGGQPLFVVGLPRTGTTLTERILASHSRVESADETFFLQIAIRRVSGVQGREDMSPRMIEAAARESMERIARDYLDKVDYRLGGKPLFIDKYPFNFLYVGFIARAFPGSRIVHLRRQPMDACFAMYKQSFFRFAYRLQDLADYYIAYDRLSRHWREHLGDRIVEVEYESLVSEPEARIRQLLERVGLEFEPACLDFHLNEAPSATASTVQVREKAHTRSVGRWRRFEDQLQPLRSRLESAGVEV